jgi:malonyl-CoA O-methyltransferase
MTASPESVEPTDRIDPVASQRRLNKAPGGQDWLSDLVAERMAERLSWLRQQPSCWLDWQPNLGGRVGHRLVSRKYPRADVWVKVLKHGKEVQSWLGKDAGWLGIWPFLRRPRLWSGGPAVDLLWANMVAHQVAYPDELLLNWHSALVERGALFFSTLGPGSLRELDAAAASMGAAPAHHPFIDMHDWGDALLRAGFAEPVMDAQRLTLTYASLDKLVTDVRAAGRNLHPGRTAHLLGRRWLARWRAALAECLPRNEVGHWLVELEVVYGHAWRGENRSPGSKWRPVQLTGQLAQGLGKKSAD